MQLLDQCNIQLWSEIQLGYALLKGRLIAITGTNGKTTTTALTGEIMKEFSKEVFVAGNIGMPFTDIVLNTTRESCTVLEVSSFQLETIIDFKPDISAILNITPDHLDRHHTMENYVRIKKDITMRQGKGEYCVLNYDDPILRAFSRECPATVLFFSSTKKLTQGVYLDRGNILYTTGGVEKPVVSISQINLLGKHNYENVMAAVAIAICAGVPIETIRRVCTRFQAVAHRMEFVAERYGVKYYNDSKATNPEAAIQAVRAIPGHMLLIAGGYDKGADYEEWIESFEGRVKYLVLIGQTRDAIFETAKRCGFTDVMYAESMDEAVKVCASYADNGDYVLLSPACASWGMFKDFEERGDVFKECVRNL